MAKEKNIFEKLVEGLDQEERKSMLERLSDVAEIDSAIYEAQSETSRRAKVFNGISKKRISLEDEGFIVRVWFKVLALFSSSSAEEKYSAYIIADLGKRLAQKYGAYILVKRRMYTDTLYKALVSLEKVRAFFVPYVNAYNNNRGDFYILLSSLISPEETKEISQAADPFSEPYETDFKRDIYSTFVKKVDDALNFFPSDEKEKIYQAAQAVEWLSIFASFPLNQIIIQFSNLTGKGQMCLLDMVTGDLKRVCSILASAVKIPSRLMVALFVFLKQEKLEDNSFAFDSECSQFVKIAADYLKDIISFKSKIPLTDFVRFSTGDILWDPDIEVYGEDWFKLFKSAWKDRFEERFAEWKKLNSGYALRKKALTFLECSELPALEHRPWQAAWIDFKFYGETVFLFLKAFFLGVYPRRISKILKIVLSEGDFRNREALAEFTDAFSELEHGRDSIENFERRLSPKGDLGEGISIALNEKLGTHAGKIKLNTLMATVNSEADTFRDNTLSALQSIDGILEGILNVSRGGQYNILSNLDTIRGVGNENLRENLAYIRVKIQECIGIITQLKKE